MGPNFGPDSIVRLPKATPPPSMCRLVLQYQVRPLEHTLDVSRYFFHGTEAMLTTLTEDVSTIQNSQPPPSPECWP